MPFLAILASAADIRDAVETVEVVQPRQTDRARNGLSYKSEYLNAT